MTGTAPLGKKGAEGPHFGQDKNFFNQFFYYFLTVYEIKRE